MYPKEVNPYYVYLQAEVRKARHARDLALAQLVIDIATGIMQGFRAFFAPLLRLELRRDDAWVEAMETKLRRHQPY